jgi:hypothetical protein
MGLLKPKCPTVGKSWWDWRTWSRHRPSGYKIILDNINWNLGSISSWGLLPSYDLWICELEFRKSGDSKSRICESGIWEFGILIWPFWGLKLHIIAWISIQRIWKQTNTHILEKCWIHWCCSITVLINNRLDFKRTKYYWSYAIPLSLGARYKRLDKASDRPYWDPW